MNVIKYLRANWKTTSAGITMLAGSVIHLAFSIKAGTANENSWTIAVVGIVGGVGFILAGDASASQQKPQDPSSNPTQPQSSTNP